MCAATGDGRDGDGGASEGRARAGQVQGVGVYVARGRHLEPHSISPRPALARVRWVLERGKRRGKDGFRNLTRGSFTRFQKCGPPFGISKHHRTKLTKEKTIQDRARRGVSRRNLLPFCERKESQLIPVIRENERRTVVDEKAQSGGAHLKKKAAPPFYFKFASRVFLTRHFSERRMISLKRSCHSVWGPARRRRGDVVGEGAVLDWRALSRVQGAECARGVSQRSFRF